LLFHRQKIVGIEIDLILLAPEGHIVFAEVKSLGARGLAAYRLGKRQKDRLWIAKTYFENLFDVNVEVRLVLVETSGPITDLVIL